MKYDGPVNPITPKDIEDLILFFRKVADLTKHHAVINDNAVVTAKDLGEALEIVDLDWTK